MSKQDDKRRRAKYTLEFKLEAVSGLAPEERTP